MNLLFEAPSAFRARASLWADELPASPIMGSGLIEVAELVCAAGAPRAGQLALEVCFSARHASSYGLLGLTVRPAHGELRARVRYDERGASFSSHNLNIARYDDTLAFNKSQVFSSFPQEYAGKVADTVRAFAQESPSKLAGILDVTTAAECVVGSSRLVFGGIAEALLRILSLGPGALLEEAVPVVLDALWPGPWCSVRGAFAR